MDSTIITGLINYPILYFNHYHQQEVVDQIASAIQRIYPTEENKNGIKDVPRVKIIDYNDVEVNKGVAWADIPSDSDVEENLEWMYIKELGEIVDNFSKPSIHNGHYIYIFRSVPCHLLQKNAEFISYLHKFISLHEYRQRSQREKEQQAINDGAELPLTPPNWAIILIVPSGELPPPSIEGVVRLVSIKPPKKEEIEQEIEKVFPKANDLDKEEFCKSLQGLQLFDIRQIIQSTKTVIGKRLSYRSVKWARDEKQQIIRKTGILDVVTPNVTFDDIGGLENLKSYLKKKALVFKYLSILQDDKVKCDVPKGVLLMGMPGCGKTMIAKAIASEFELPLLRLDIGKLLGQYVGQSETNLRRALDVADSAHPCILWIDEVEKAFAGTNNKSGDNNDLMMRLMGTFLTWMQEREYPVYIVATANDVMKPELMRKGRFDEVFFVDFPNLEERVKIAEAISAGYERAKDSVIHFNVNWEKVAEEMVVEKNKIYAKNGIGLSGAEIRSLIASMVEAKCIERIQSFSSTEHLDFKTFKGKEIIEITTEDFTKEIINKEGKVVPKSLLDEFLQSAMIRQSSWLFRERSKKEADDIPTEEEMKDNFIDRIYGVQKKYQFKSAS